MDRAPDQPGPAEFKENVMKMFRNVLAFAALAALLSAPLAAQQGNPNSVPTFTDTYLTAALTSNANTMSINSEVGFTAGTTMAQIDNEFVAVSVVPPGSTGTIRITRGVSGTRATKHGLGARVRVAPNANFSACGGSSTGQVPCGNTFNTATANNFSSGLFYPQTTATILTTASALTYTPGQVLGGMIFRDPNGAARSDTMPTAALLINAVPGATVGTTFDFWLHNDADASETITLVAGSGGTTSGTMTVAQNAAKIFRVRFTVVLPGSEAYVVYSMGSVTF
jgi:hypothetical protein